MVLTAFIMVVVADVMLGGLDARRFTPDSWMYYELSQNIFTDFYRIWTHRTFFFEQPYGAGFPPFFPFCIAIIARLTGMAWGANVVVDVVAFVGLAWCSASIAQTLCGSRSVGLLTTLASLCFLPLSDELVAGRSHPLTLLFFACIVLILVRVPRIDIRSAAALGVISGLSVMTRFDFAIPAVVIAALLLLWTRRLAIPIVYSLATAVIVLPWVWYSYVHFGVAFVSDNGWVAAAADTGYSQSDYVDPPGPRRISGMTDLFFKLVAAKSTIFELGVDLVRHLAPGAAALLCTAVSYKMIWRVWPHAAIRPIGAPYHRLGWLLVIWVAIAFEAWMAGYADVRYLSGFVWQGWMLALCVIAVGLKRVDSRMIPRLSRFLAGFLAIVALALGWYGHLKSTADAGATAERRSLDLAGCLRSAGGTPDDMVLLANELAAGEFGALAHWATAYPPHNRKSLSSIQYANLIQRFHVGFIELTDDTPAALRSFGVASPLPGCPLTIERVAAKPAQGTGG